MNPIDFKEIKQDNVFPKQFSENSYDIMHDTHYLVVVTGQDKSNYLPIVV